MKTSLTKRRPGDFRAVCKQGAWVPFHTLTEEQRAVEGLQTRWDRTLALEVALVPCTLDTTDREVYAQHMAELHGDRKLWDSPWNLGDTAKTYRPRMPIPVKLPKGPAKATAAGRPFKPTKALERDLETCGECGLVAEVTDTEAAQLWWREHVERCTGETQRGAA